MGIYIKPLSGADGRWSGMDNERRTLGPDTDRGDIGIGGANAAPREKKLAAFLVVTALAVGMPLVGIAAFAALVPALAACIASGRSGARYLYFIPGAALSVALGFALGVSLPLYGTMLGGAVVCGTLLGVAAKRRASATAQTVTAALAIFAVAAAAIAVVSYSVFGSVEDALRAAYDYAVDAFASVAATLESAVANYTAADPQGASALELYSLTGLDATEVVRSFMLAMPGLVAAVSFVFGWVWQLAARLFLAMFGRRDMITDVRRVAIPASLAVIFLVLRLMTLFGSQESLFFVCASNVVTALGPVMLVVGGGFLLDVARRGRSRFSIMFIIMFAISSFIMPSIFFSVLPIAGVIGTVVRSLRERRERKS